MKAPLKSNTSFRSIAEVKRLIPAESSVNSFLFYSGEVETSLCSTGRKVMAHTNRYAIYEFWMHLLADRHSLARAAAHIYPTIDDSQFYFLQEDWNTYKDPKLRAALFFIMNRSSSTGLVTCGELCRENFNPASFTLLKRFDIENLYPVFNREENLVQNIRDADPADYTLLPVGKYNFNLFDYGKSRGADVTPVHHRDLAQFVYESKQKIVLLYKKHPALFTLYANHNIQMVDAYGRLTGDMEKCEEVIIANF